MRQVLQAPNAAAVAVHTLRVLEGLELERALSIESMAYAVLQGSEEHARWLAARTPQPASAPGCVLVERRGDILHVTMDRPAAHNAIDHAMRDQLHESFTLAALDRDITAVRLRGLGEAFCIGGDLEEFGVTRDPASAHLIRAQTLPALTAVRCADKLNAHIQGACVGAGAELAAFAKRVTAAPNAWFQLPELAMGLIPGAGGCVSVPRRIGRQRAALMILSGRRINAATALRWGLVDAIEERD